MIYTDKALEELKAIIDTYSLSYQSLYGSPPDKEDIKQRLTTLIQERKDKDFRSRFETLSPNNLHQAINIISEKTIVADESKLNTKLKSNSKNKSKI